MKKTLTLVGLGACVLMAFPSCKSTDGDGFYDDTTTEEALPMSFVGDDEYAPWDDGGTIPDFLMEDNGNGPQVAAGETTLIPAPDEPVAANEQGGRVSAGQNNPQVAAPSSQNKPDVVVADDVFVDNTPITPENDPLLTPIPSTPAAPSTPAVTKPATPKPIAKSGSGTTKKGGATKQQSKKRPAKKISKPTLIVYTVKKGDNLSEIARRSNTTVAQIRKDSGIKGDIIHPGQTIKVRFTPKGYKSQTSSKTSGKNGKSGKNSKETKKQTSTTSKGGKTYTVRNGETISGIAKKNGISTAALLKANGMSNADAAKMRAGKKLVIPKH